jgi:hypothetical protein
MDELTDIFSKCGVSNNYWNLIRTKKKTIIEFSKINNKMLSIIILINNEYDIMERCYFEILSTAKKFPPAKNENKFVYGKLIEKALINAFIKCGFNCIDLDSKHTVGSEYKNDIRMLNMDISIKALKNKGSSIVLINKNGKKTHNVDNIQMILCIINEGKLYFIPNNLIDNDIYVNDSDSQISYRSKLITMFENKYEKYIYNFPKLSKEYQDKLELITEISIYDKLYEEEIVSL